MPSVSPSVPGSPPSLAMMSASMITAPCAASLRATSLLPDAIPPVSPTMRDRTSVSLTGMGCRAQRSGPQGRQHDRLDGLHPVLRLLEHTRVIRPEHPVGDPDR